MKKVKLTGELVEAFAGTFLSVRYDDPRPTPRFHREAWDLYASDNPQCLVIAPRDHAKSTALTFDYILAEACFRTSDYIILIGSTEPKASEQLSNISEELHTNEDLRREFDIKYFETDQKTEIIVVCGDGHRFRILARGAEQKIRGAMWNGKRPNLIVCDDMEDDEQVESKPRRSKFRRWFFRAAKQALSKSGKMRVHGTVLHEDALLPRLMKNRQWKHLFYKAHKSYDDFSEILWPERWSEQELRAKRQEFEDDGDAAGYSQEWLNTPTDNADAYIKKSDLHAMDEEDYNRPMRFFVGCDFAVTKNAHSNKTSFTIGGLCTKDLLCVVREVGGKLHSDEWINLMFEIEEAVGIDVWYVEGGQIWNTVAPMVIKEMATREIYLNIEVLNPTKDKAVRGRAFQKRTRTNRIKFDKKGDWYAPYEHEILQFTGVTEAKEDDRFDSTATLCLGVEGMPALEEDDFMDEEEQEVEYQNNVVGFGPRPCTGY